MTALTIDNLNHLFELAQLEPEPEQQEHLLKQLNSFFDMVKQMQAINTDDVEPLHTPLALTQEFALRMRDDIVTAPSSEEARDLAQRNAPAAEDGFFLVPKVIES